MCVCAVGGVWWAGRMCERKQHRYSFQCGLCAQHKFGRVIGKAGSTLRALEREHGVVVTRGPTGNFLVLAAEEAALRSGVAAIHTLAAAHF